MTEKNLEIKELNTQLGQVVIPDAVIGRLEEKEIKTLKDIRRKGGVPRFEDLPPEEEKAVKKVEAHAYISLISDDTKVNDTLIDAGFRNTADISRLTRNDFVVKAKEAGIKADIASAIHAKSTAASAVFNNVITSARVEMANNFDIEPAVDIEGVFPVQCECRECESAVSPLAYLTDLLDYTTTHVKKNTGYSIDLNTLEAELHQPFKRYIAACEEVDRKVRQVRICIEVLRSHLKDDSPYPSYLFEAYKTLLSRIGTSYDEIRLARTAAPDKREALANRLGIDLSEERPDELDALFLTSENITEQTLEKLFGLVDTTRDPLSDGAKIPDFLSWRLKHLRTLWKEQDWPGDPYTQRILPIIDPDVINPDDFRITEQNESVFELWKERREWVDQTMEQLDRDRKINGLDHILEHTLKLVLGGDPLPDLDALLKNLRKGENLEDTEDQIRSMNLTVESFTRLMEIRAKHIRAENNYESEAVNNEEWREVYSILIQAGKKIVYAYCIAEEQEKHVNLGPKQFWISLRQPKEGDWPPAHLAQQPVIDPELLNVEELPEPLAGGYAVVIWEARRARLDQIYEKLKAEQEERGFVAMLKLAVGDPEPGDDLLHDLDNLEENLHSTDPEVVATAKWNITNGLHMTVIAFRRLMSIKAKADNPDSEPTDEEWAEVYAINTSAFKLKREYPNWISQEEKLPLIDHDVLELSDLTEPTIGKRAIALWHARRTKVDRTYENLKDTSETEGLDTMLREALGEPDPGNPLPHNLAELNENLKSGDSERVNEATIKITNDLFMTVTDFTRLMEIKDKYADPNTLEKPAEKEWAEVTTILTQAQKAKREYPNWKEEEQDNDIVFWSALKAKLPHWRATQEARQQWQQALRNRSQAPIIDPDVIGEYDLKNLIDDDPAYEILQARRNWVRDQLDALEMAHGEEEAWLNWGYEGIGNGLFKKPQGVAIDSSGNVYVADSNNHRIQKFDPWGEVIDVWGGPEDGQFEKPQGVAVDSSGNVYVVDTDNHRIQKFDSDGRLLKQWGEEGSEKGEFKRPSGAAVDVNSGDVYVADTKNHRIQKFDSDGGFIREWGEEGNRDGAFKNPRGVAVDSSGKVYVADSENHRIQKFDSDGNIIAVWGQEEGNGDGEFSLPAGVAVDSSRNVYVADSNNHRIQKFDSDGRFLMRWGRYGSEDRQFKTPSGVAVDRSGNVYVADTYNNRIHACIVNLTVLKFRAIINSTLGISLKDLMDLAEERKQGNDISARLDQLSLSMTAFLYLLRIHDLLVSDAEIMDSEWDDVSSILVQVQKRRSFAEWRDEESEKGIIMSSDFFVISEEEPEELHPWRASWEARRDWQDKLGSRIDQEKTVCAAMAEAVDACEEATLTLLRDGLVEASDAEGNDITAKAKRLTEQLLIDCQIDACQKTTRISQAIITLQKLIFSLRTGQLENSELELDPGENFEDEWMWMGSYETWKAAVGVFLYPENILLPGLRRQQTPAFRQLVSGLRSNRRLTPENACQSARSYSDYFRDVCNLTLEATCHAETHLHSGGCRNREDKGTKYLFYMFGRGGTTNAVFWSTYDRLGESDYAQTFWDVVPGLDHVVNIIGAVPYKITDEDHYIFLFARTRNKGAKKLVFIKYDLEKQLWDAEATELELPKESQDKETVDFTAVVKQHEREENPPHLAIRVPNGTIYDHHLNREGNVWQDAEWKPLICSAKGSEFREICSMVEIAKQDEFYMLAITKRGDLYYRLFGSKDDGKWRELVLVPSYQRKDIFRGAISWSGNSCEADSYRDYCYVWFDKGSSGTDCCVIKRSQAILERALHIPSIQAFEDWLTDVAGVSLRECLVPVPIFNAPEMPLYDVLRLEDLGQFSVDIPWDYILPMWVENYEERLLFYVKVASIKWFTSQIDKTDDYTDKDFGKWKLADELVKQFSREDEYDESGRGRSLELALLSLAYPDTSGFHLLSRDGDPDIIDTYEYGPHSYRFIPTNGPVDSEHFDDQQIVMEMQEVNGQEFHVVCCTLSRPPSHWRCRLTYGYKRVIAPEIRKSLPIDPFDIRGHFSSGDLQKRRTMIRNVFDDNRWSSYNLTYPESNLTYLAEAWYFLPILLALQLQRAGQYTAALDWYRTVYDYTIADDSASAYGRKIYYGLRREEGDENGYARPDEWLLDPLNVHAIASIRRNTYTRFTLLSIIRCLFAYADTEFTRDTVESLAKARTLYETALELLEIPELNQHLNSCAEIIGYLEIELVGADRKGAWKRIIDDMICICNTAVLESTTDKVRQLIRSSGEISTRIAEARQVVREALNEQRPTTIGNMFDTRRRIVTEIPKKLLENESVEKGVEKAVLFAEIARRPGAVDAYAPTVATLPFCIPPNPMIKALGFHAEINLHKLRTCRNVAGVKREIEAYAAPTDILSAMPSIGPGGQLVIPTRITPPPVPYRYEFLIERAKQLANMAAQMEGALLSALEKRDVELYSQLRARQDVRLAHAGVRLQDLRLRQTQDEVVLAELQQESAQIQAKTYQEWLDAGLNQWEQRMIDAYHEAEDAQILAAFFDAGAQLYQAAASATAWGAGAAFMVSLMAMGGYAARGVAIGAETQAQVANVWASYERRAQEWQLQSELAQQSIRIGVQQIRIANDGVNIVRHEKNIAKMQVEHAEAIVEFLNSKFTNVELYDWMIGVLEGVYSFFLQHATSMAKLAQNQLAFERQEPPPAFIQDDYWEVPTEELMGGATENAVDRHGLTGSARLAADIYKLDQYRLETEKRKLQLTKSFSLARMAPFEFQRFRETGVIVFGTSMALFDRDFPGHYLRMIKRVRTSVIALIPPLQGIKATFSNIGVSRIVTNNNGLFQPITAHRPPESVALTSPSNATGLFELESQSEMLLPFEGLGVDTAWEFRMPKAANRFDYSTIADVIITTEYTALDSFDYRQQVIETLPSKVSANRPFSFRHQFADQWYDLHNPEQTATPMCVRFRTRREDFPPNIENLKIEHVVLYFAGAGGESSEIEASLHFRPEGGMADIGGEAASIDGVISTRRGNAGSWTVMIGQSTVGDWALTLPDTGEMKKRFKNEEIGDILFVITYSGRTPEWPE